MRSVRGLNNDYEPIPEPEGRPAVDGFGEVGDPRRARFWDRHYVPVDGVSWVHRLECRGHLFEESCDHEQPISRNGSVS